MADNFIQRPGSPDSLQAGSQQAGSRQAGSQQADYRQAEASDVIADELEAAGVPAHLRGWLVQRGVGALVVKLGIVFEELTAERSVATMPVEGNTQVAGILHGGASAALAETLGSFSASLHAGPGRHAVGVDLNVTHHRPAVRGHVRGTCTAVHLGRTLTTHEIVVADEDGRRLASARITNLLRDNPEPKDSTRAHRG